MNTKHDVEQWKSLYESGLSYKKIGDMFGVDFRTVWYNLKKLGVVGRRPAFYHSGEKNYFWTGGSVVEKKNSYTSYRLIYAPDHPYKNHKNKVREHRLVMEKHLGRYLLPHEVVDHIDGNGLNNDISNLKLYSSNAEHLKATKKGCCPRYSEDGKKRMCDAAKKRAQRVSDLARVRNFELILRLFSKYPRGSQIPRSDVLELLKLKRRLVTGTYKNEKHKKERDDLLLQIQTFLLTCRRPSRRNPFPIRTIV